MIGPLSVNFQGIDALGRFFCYFYKGDNFGYFLFVLVTSCSGKRSTLKGKNLFPGEANSCIL